MDPSEPPLLVLHFNTSKTVWTCDEDNSTEFFLLEALSETSWGTLNVESHEWELSEDDRCTFTPKDDSLISYLDHLHQQYPMEGEHLDESTIEEHNRQVRMKIMEFVTKPCGQKMRPAFEQMVKNLSLPKAVLKAYDINKVVLNEKDVAEDPLAEDHSNSARFGRNRFVPSFLTFINYLIKEGRKFQIVFRGLGPELEQVVHDWNLYCEGRHPGFSGQNKTKRVLLNGEKNSRDMRVKETHVGTIDRMGRFVEFPLRNATPSVPGEEDLGMFTPTKYTLFHGIYAGILEISSEGSVSIQDDLDFYNANDKVPESSKLLLVDQGETKIQQIFFDGTLSKSSDSTVDVREVVYGESLKYDDCIDADLWRVNLVKAITDPNYYVNSLVDLEKNFQERIRRRREVARDGLGIGNVASEDDQPLSSKRYIYQNIVPTLLPALEICARDRPQDPLELIAFYMLRHKTQYAKQLNIVNPEVSAPVP